MKDMSNTNLAGKYTNYRWHEGSTKNTNSNGVHDDSARLRCHTCNVNRELYWDRDSKQFQIRAPGSSTHITDDNLWKECHNGGPTSTVCPYSAGTCFVEERRVWGYVLQVRAGCKQAQACYMQKYQNFLVKAGRQCWPSNGATSQIAKRPYDLMADQWIWNIVQGGVKNQNAAGAAFADSAGAGNPFDETFTDSNGLLTHGFYVTGGSRGTESVGSNSNLVKMSDKVSNSYKNGQVPTSKCYQCCNTDHNCNHNWQPQSETDWEEANIFGYRAGGTGTIWTVDHTKDESTANLAALVP